MRERERVKEMGRYSERGREVGSAREFEKKEKDQCMIDERVTYIPNLIYILHYPHISSYPFVYRQRHMLTHTHICNM